MMSWGAEGWLMMGLWFLALMFLVWLVVRVPHQAAEEDALQILRARFARGEINQVEFEQATNTLLAAQNNKWSK